MSWIRQSYAGLSQLTLWNAADLWSHSEADSGQRLFFGQEMILNEAGSVGNASDLC